MNREGIEQHVKTAGLNIINVVNVWSNGRKIRLYSGQNEKTKWHNPSDDYRKMVAILIEEGDD